MAVTTMLSLLLLLLLAAAPAGATSYTTSFYSQKLDHFNPADARRWPHRYLHSAEHWDGRGRLPNGCKGPVLLYTGNEGAITGFWGSNGFMIDVLAPKWGALLLFPEERFYGASLPFGNGTFDPAHAGERLRFLTTAQVRPARPAVTAVFPLPSPLATGCSPLACPPGAVVLVAGARGLRGARDTFEGDDGGVGELSGRGVRWELRGHADDLHAAPLPQHRRRRARGLGTRRVRCFAALPKQASLCTEGWLKGTSKEAGSSGRGWAGTVIARRRAVAAGERG